MDGQLSKAAQGRVKKVFRDSLGDRFKGIEFEWTEDWVTGEDKLVVKVFVPEGTTAEDFKGGVFGLTGRVRDAMGDDMLNVFPYIRPMEAVTEANA